MNHGLIFKLVSLTTPVSPLIISQKPLIYYFSYKKLRKGLSRKSSGALDMKCFRFIFLIKKGYKDKPYKQYWQKFPYTQTYFNPFRPDPGRREKIN